MKVAVIGRGGREHAIAWKIAQSKEVEKVCCIPGNAGTAEIAENASLKDNSPETIADFVEEKCIDLTVVGPEDPLVEGIVDLFQKRGLNIFGPNKKAAIIEGSKIFTRELLQKYNIPSAEFGAFDDAEKAKDYLHEKGAPIVVKADGLAAGKGVIVCDTIKQAEEAINKIMIEKEFGKSGEHIILEEKLVGEECSYLVFTDGRTIRPMASTQDHKAIYDGDKGPNTGGMGAYSPAPVVTKDIEKEILETIMQPTVDAMRKEGREYRGVLYGGLMITRQGPKVLEFNARFGDPETQALLPRLESDLVKILQACIDGTLAEQGVKWSKKAACCVVMASGGYPGHYEKGKEIFGLKEAAKLPNTVVFHAGTKLADGKVLTDGGRVLGVTALGNTIKGSIGNAYWAVKKISFEKAHYRNDIGQKALKRNLPRKMSKTTE